MNILIAGDGEVGFHLAKLLSGEHHNITIVDPQKELLKLVESESDLLTITGNSTSVGILKSANVENADLLLAVVHDEHINLLTCILGKRLGAARTIARINNTEYLEEPQQAFFRSIGVDEMVCPERIAALEIMKLLNQSAATEIFDFSDGSLQLFMIKLDENAQVIGKSLDEIALSHPNLEFRAVAIHREGNTLIPKGKDVFQVNDLAYVITKPQAVDKLLQMGGKKQVDIRNVMIVGGGRIGRKLALNLEHQMNIRLIEIDMERCNVLADLLEDTLIINGDARNFNLLQDEGIRNMDAFVAVTDDSETNIFTCLLAKKFGVRKIIPLVENVDYIDISQNIGIETIINKKLITASYIVRWTMGPEVISSKCLHGIDADVFEFIVKENADINGKRNREHRMTSGAIIGGISRGEESHIAVGDFRIEEGDKVVVFALPEAIRKMAKLF